MKKSFSKIILLTMIAMGTMVNAYAQNYSPLRLTLYVECVELVNGQKVVHIADRLPGLIADKGLDCVFTDEKEKADYAITVNARLARCQDAPDNIVFCYANATVSVWDAYTQEVEKPKLIEAKGGWTDRNRANATEEAFDELANQIAEKVVNMIKN